MEIMLVLSLNSKAQLRALDLAPHSDYGGLGATANAQNAQL